REHLAGADETRSVDDVLGTYVIERADLIVLAPAPPVLELLRRLGDRLAADLDVHFYFPVDRCLHLTAMRQSARLSGIDQFDSMLAGGRYGSSHRSQSG